MLASVAINTRTSPARRFIVGTSLVKVPRTHGKCHAFRSRVRKNAGESLEASPAFLRTRLQVLLRPRSCERGYKSSLIRVLANAATGHCFARVLANAATSHPRSCERGYGSLLRPRSC